MSGIRPSVEDLVPHRFGMKLIEEVLEVDNDNALTSSTVKESWPGLANGKASWVVLIELVAQTMAASLGWKNLVLGEPPKIGYLVGIKEASFFSQSIPMNTRLFTRTHLITSAGAYGIVRGRVEAGSELLCDIELQVFRSD